MFRAVNSAVCWLDKTHRLVKIHRAYYKKYVSIFRVEEYAKQDKKLRGLSPLANFADRELSRSQRFASPTAVISLF
jgi:hypothetical protein